MRSSRPRDRAASQCRKLLDGGRVALNLLRIGESPGPLLAGQLSPDEDKRPFDEIVGQLSRDAGGLTEIPTMREQVGNAPLQSLGTGGDAQLCRLASLKKPWTAYSSLQRGRGSPVGSGRIGTEMIGTAVGHRAVIGHRHEHQVRAHQVIDQIPDVPLCARGRQRPLPWIYLVNQVRDDCGCTCEIIDGR